MINKISSINNNLKLHSVPSFRSNEIAKENPVVVREEKDEVSSLKAFESYAMAKVGMGKKYDVQPLIPTIYLPEAISAIKGQRILDSQGKLDTIVYENNDIKTSYVFDKENEGMIKTITSTDKKTGHVIKHQENIIEDGKYEDIYITSYSPMTGKELYFTSYEDGKPEYATKYIYGRNGAVNEISKDFERKEIFIREISKDGKAHNVIKMSEDMRFITVDSSKKVNNKTVETTADFYNGALISVEERKRTEIPNLVAQEPMYDKDFAPEPELSKAGWQKLAESLDGEKTYYSNGVVETAKGNVDDVEITAHFNVSGEVEMITTRDEVVEIAKHSISRTETKPDGTVKRTMINDNGFRYVMVAKDGHFKELSTNKNQKPSSYHEGKIDEDGHQEFETSFFYTDKGFLEKAFN